MLVRISKYFNVLLLFFGGLIYGLCMSWLVLVHGNEQVKLDPSMVDAWCCLGNCFWKKGDLVQAKNCFNIALSKVSILFTIFVFQISAKQHTFLHGQGIDKEAMYNLVQGLNKKALQQLSMLERRIAKGKLFVTLARLGPALHKQRAIVMRCQTTYSTLD